MSLLTYSLLKKEIENVDVNIEGATPTSNSIQLQRIGDNEVRSLYYYTQNNENKLYGINDFGIVELRGNNWEQIYTSPNTPASVYRMNSGRFIVWYGGFIEILDSTMALIKTHQDKYNPLNVTVGVTESDDTLMFSEYSGATGTDGKRIWKTTNNGDTFELAIELQSIGHWHSVQYDPYSDSWWACPGDGGWAAQIRQSTDNGETWDIKADSDQIYRNCGLGFTEDYIVWLPDNPSAGENNAIYRISRADIDGDWDTLREVVMSNVSGASYGCTRTNDGRVLFFTSAESTHYSGLYMSDGDNSEMVARTFKDHKSSILLAGFTQVTHCDHNNVAYVRVNHSDNMDGIYKAHLPLIKQ